MSSKLQSGAQSRNETAGGLVVESVPRAALTDTVGQLLGRLEGKQHATVEIVLVHDDKGRHVGVAPVGDVLAAPRERSLADILRRDWPSARSDLDREQAVELAIAAGVSTLPVIGHDGRAIGYLTAPILLDVLAREHREDVHRMAGILRERANERHALEDPPLSRSARRLPWLLVGLALSAGGTAVMAGFEETIRRNVTVAFFIPALVYLTDAIGTQTEAIAVRGLSATRSSILELLGREVVTGSLIGGALGAIAVAGISLVFGDVRLAMAVGLSLLIAGAFASALGLALPWGLSRIGIDPALGSGPVATILQDVLTLLVYFVIVVLVVAQP